MLSCKGSQSASARPLKAAPPFDGWTKGSWKLGVGPEPVPVADKAWPVLTSWSVLKWPWVKIATENGTLAPACLILSHTQMEILVRNGNMTLVLLW